MVVPAFEARDLNNELSVDNIDVCAAHPFTGIHHPNRTGAGCPSRPS